MTRAGWKTLLAGAPWFQGAGRFPITAYSEFVPPPWLANKPYGPVGPTPFADDAPWGWTVSEYEELIELQPGLQNIACQVLYSLSRLGQGLRAQGIAKNKLHDNRYWPPELAAHAGRLPHERYVVLLPLALTRTQDDKGRVRWTLLGGSEQGPARAFWRGFFTAPDREVPAEQGLGFFREILHTVYEEPREQLADLRRAGFRILPGDDDPALPFWGDDPLPRWTEPLVWTRGQPIKKLRYLVTFRPFGQLPRSIQQAYLAGGLHLLPFPGSLFPWGVPTYLRLHEEQPLAVQIPLLHMVDRHEAVRGIRVPQSGWLHEPRPEHPEPNEHYGPVRNTYKRTHRWARVHRHEDELAVVGKEDKLAHVLFSTSPDDMGLYGKPMARNAQIWTANHHLLLDGPRATAEEIHQAADALREGGLFGYRFVFPAMRVGPHEVYWHRPLAAYLAKTGEAALLPHAPLGYLTVYRADKPNLAKPRELWPRLLQREEHLTGLTIFAHEYDRYQHQTAVNVRKLLDTHQQMGTPLPHSLARALLTVPKGETLEGWLATLAGRTPDGPRGLELEARLRSLIDFSPAELPPALTYAQTATRPFEVRYWKTIAALATGQYINKDNADCVRDPATQAKLRHHHRDLEALGDYLLAYYTEAVLAAGLTGKALVGDLPFTWRTDYEFSWMGGWLANQETENRERNLITVIPGRDRRRAIVMADHYDTAYMIDHYDPAYGGSGARLAAAGADDNHSATVALMLAAPIFLALSKAGKLGCDIWLIHLTGEEFPADCLGARHLAQALVEGTLKMRLAGGGQHDLSHVRVDGLYVADMIAHNNDRDRDVFQIAPGTGPQALWLAYQAHLANEIWNASVPAWNRRPGRRACGRGRRSADGVTVPATARHLHVHGDVRLPYAARSTLYNTDGQVFSDAGVPCVLFMENYDINRTGYHDTHDTMENIDLDYGAAVAAIFIEAVARAATEKRGVGKV